MNKLLLITSALGMSFGLVGCHTVNHTVDGTSRVVGTGVKYTATAVGTGVGLVSNTGAAIGRGVGTVVSTGVGLVGGNSATYQQTKYQKKSQTVYHNGHRYILKNGKYVRVD